VIYAVHGTNGEAAKKILEVHRFFFSSPLSHGFFFQSQKRGFEVLTKVDDGW